MRKMFLTMFAVLFLIFGVTSAASAAPQDTPGVVAMCQELGEQGTLESDSLTMGECVNRLRAASSENANNWNAGYCGWARVEMHHENKGECVSNNASS